MKTLMTVLFLFLVLTTVGCFETPDEQEAKAEQRRDQIAQEKWTERQTYVKSVQRLIKEEVVYVQDPRNGFCFAVFSMNPRHYTATAGLTLVPCERIPPELLNK